MSVDFTAAAARARGLRTHVLGRAALEGLASGGPSALGPSLSRLLGPLEGDAGPTQLEARVRRAVAQVVDRLRRWDGAWPVLVLFEAGEDRRSLRALLRGALQGAPAEARLRGLLATPTLPERALQLLAHQPTLAAVASRLVALDHPDGPALSLLTAGQAHPELLPLELALAQGWARRLRPALRAGDRHLRRLIRQRVDVANAVGALLLAVQPDVDPTRAFLDGGRALPRDAFLEIARAGPIAPRTLERVWKGRTLERLLRPTVSAGEVEARARAAELEEVRALARREPLSSAPVLRLTLELSAMAADLQRIAWGMALGAAGPVLVARLETPP